MTINERIKKVRKSLNLSQADFSNKLGMSQRNISYLEAEGSTITEQNIKLICNVFNIDEVWLRNGNDNTVKHKVLSEEDEFLRCAAVIGESENDIFKQVIIKYANLDPTSKKIIDNFFQSLFESVKE